MNTSQKLAGLKKIMIQLRSKGGIVIDADTAPKKHLQLAEKEGWIMTHEITGKRWIWVESLLSCLLPLASCFLLLISNI